MNDRELLEMAARAACIGDVDIAGRPCVLVVKDSGIHQSAWSPLTDDGDALRLAVKLGIASQYKRNAEPELGLPRECAVAVTEDGQWFSEAGMEECAATRRAIVRAAAEIGAGMQSQPATEGLPEDNYYKTMAEAEGVAGAEDRP